MQVNFFLKSVFSKEINTSRVQKDGTAVEYEEVAGNANWDTTKNRQNAETITQVRKPNNIGCVLIMF